MKIFLKFEFIINRTKKACKGTEIFFINKNELAYSFKGSVTLFCLLRFKIMYTCSL